ncbi:MAG: hypothetical protein AAF631_05855 [Pseudomonadota bacterium]
MDTRDAAQDWLAHRARFRAELCAVAAATAAILRATPADRDRAQVDRLLTRLVRLRRDLVALLKERVAVTGAPGFRKLSPAARRDVEDDGPFGADPRRMLDIWNRVQAATRMAADFDSAPLLADPPPVDGLHQAWLAMDGTMNALHEYVNPRGSQDATRVAEGSFPDIPLPASDFMATCQAALRVCLAQGRHGPLSFLDVGCGGGIKVLMAAHIFARADGLEYDDGYAATAEKLLGSVGGGRSDIIRGDGITWDGYDRYEVIYLFKPVREDSGLRRMERRIIEGAAAGSVVIAPYPGFAERVRDLGCGHLAGPLWLTDTSAEEAAALAHRATAMAPVVVAHPVELGARAGLLHPITDALAARGFLIPTG